jgi:RimJ/RimL family protein N-acetyltransferase
MANDPVTRAASRETRSIRPEEHLTWFRRTREAMGRTSWVAEIDGLVIGQVRFAKLDEGWELHYGLDPVARGRGWSSGMVTEGLRRLAESGRTGDVFAVVHPANEVSRRSLAKLGFLPDDAGRAAAAGACLPDGFTAYVRAGGTAPR